jgi:hypothetical protein
MLLRRTNMKNTQFYVKIAFTMILLSVSLGTEAATSVANLQDLDTKDVQTIEVEVARFVAQSALPLFYKGNWQYFDHLVYYDLEGKPVTFAIVFQQQPEDTNVVLESTIPPPIDTDQLENMEETIKEMRELSSALSNQITRTQVSNDLTNEEKVSLTNELVEERCKVQRLIWGLGDFVTVITGARYDMPLVIKCHEGLPLAFVMKSDAEALMRGQSPPGSWQAQRLVYIDRFNEAVEVVEDTSPGIPMLSVSDEDWVVNLRTRKAERRSALRQRLEASRQGRLQKSRLTNSNTDAARLKNQQTWDIWKRQFYQDPSSQSLTGDSAGMGSIHVESFQLVEAIDLPPEQQTSETSSEVNQ